jgi:hypothetical protein
VIRGRPLGTDRDHPVTDGGFEARPPLEKPKPPRRVRFAPGGPGGLRCHEKSTDGEPNTWPEHFTRAQGLSLLSVSILAVLRGGSGAASNVTQGGRSLRRGYAGAKLCRVRQEGVHSQNHLKDKQLRSTWNPQGVTKGKDFALRTPGQESFFASAQNRPTGDSMYLADRINARWNTDNLTPAAIQKLVTSYGVQLVEDKLRELHGFPPEEAIRSPYAYLETMLKEGL